MNGEERLPYLWDGEHLPSSRENDELDNGEDRTGKSKRKGPARTGIIGTREFRYSRTTEGRK